MGNWSFGRLGNWSFGGLGNWQFGGLGNWSFSGLGNWAFGLLVNQLVYSNVNKTSDGNIIINGGYKCAVGESSSYNEAAKVIHTICGKTVDNYWKTIWIKLELSTSLMIWAIIVDNGVLLTRLFKKISTIILISNLSTNGFAQHL